MSNISANFKRHKIKTSKLQSNTAKMFASTMVNGMAMTVTSDLILLSLLQ